MSDNTGSPDAVRLPDLETIRRFSIAVRSEHADVDEVIDALRQDLQRLLEQTGRLRSKKEEPERKAASRPTSKAKTGKSQAKTRKR